MSDAHYYEKSLHSLKLFEVYNTRIDRIKKFLSEEINFARKYISKDDDVLEIGAGYGRIIKELAASAKSIVGIDISGGSVEYGKRYLRNEHNAALAVMDAYTMRYAEQFDVTLCLQNGISAIKGSRDALVLQAINATKENGTILFSTYSEKIWEERLRWFEEQSQKGLIGEIDWEHTENGRIQCYDGFTATTCTKKDFTEIGEKTGCEFYIREHDESSLFLILHKRKK